MNRTAIIVLVIVVVLGGIWLTKRNSSQEGTSTAPDAERPTSLRELVTGGGSMKCAFQRVEGSQTTSGTVYMAAGKMRGDFELQGGASGSMQSHMITDGKEMWTWSPMMPQGVKMMIPATGEQTTGENQQAVNWDEKLEYKCSNWTADQSQFTPPSDVKFMDLSQLPGAMMK